MGQGIEREDNSTAVGLSLKTGTTIIDHVIIGASIYPASPAPNAACPNSKEPLVERGVSICSVANSDVDANSVARCLSSGPVGSKVLVHLKNDSGKSIHVEIVRQNAHFGKFPKIFHAVSL